MPLNNQTKPIIFLQIPAPMILLLAFYILFLSPQSPHHFLLSFHFSHSLSQVCFCLLTNTFLIASLETNELKWDLEVAINSTQVKLVTLVEGDPKAPLSIATTLRCRGRHYSIPWIVPLHPWSLPYSAEF